MRSVLCGRGVVTRTNGVFSPAIYHPHPTVTQRDMRFYAHTPHGTEGVNLYWEGFFNAKSKQNFT